MSITDFFQWIYDTPLGEEVRVSEWLFPAFETIHVLALVFVVGSIARMDMRLLGWIWRDRPVTEVAAQVLPWTWVSFVIAVIFGVLLFTSNAVRYADNFSFQMKMLFMVLAAVNMLFFHLGAYRSVGTWDRDPSPPFAAKLAGALSLILWVGVVAFGRWIGFTI